MTARAAAQGQTFPPGADSLAAVRAEGARLVQPEDLGLARALLAKYVVHHHCALGECRPYLVAVDQLRNGCPIVAGQYRDVLHRNAIGGQD